MIDKSKKYILCYHSVGDDNWRFTTSSKNFYEQMNYLHKNYQLKSLSQLLASDQGGVNISFDDGYSNLIKNVLPILKKAKLSATLFVIGDRKKANRRELNNTLSLLNDKELLLLRANNWEIGFHTKTHANLFLLNDQKLREEIVDAKQELEKKLDLKMKFFSYPRGHYSAKIISYVKKAGFLAAFSVDGKALINKTNNVYLLPRFSIEGKTRVNQLAALLSPLGFWLNGIMLKALIYKAKLYKF